MTKAAYLSGEDENSSRRQRPPGGGLLTRIISWEGMGLAAVLVLLYVVLAFVHRTFWAPRCSEWLTAIVTSLSLRSWGHDRA